MDIATLDISPDEATARLRDYEALIASERTVEDDAIRAGYRAIARGFSVIHLPTVIAEGGRFPDGLPRLAVIRATATECFVRIGYSRDNLDTVIYSDQWADRGRAAVGRHRVAVRVPGVRVNAEDRAWTGRTIVPLIPPQHRPLSHRLHRFHILWEVEKWDPTPPVDPALLRHIRGDLWSVHATWDLTELERAVLSARRT